MCHHLLSSRKASRGIYPRDLNLEYAFRSYVEVCCKVGSEFVCPTKVPLFFKFCVTELSSVVVDNICDISFFLFSFLHKMRV